MNSFICIAAAVAAVTTATPALAETSPAPARIAISDLDLSTAAGKRTLAKRIAVVTEARCGSFALADTAAFEKVAACRKLIRSEVSPQVAAVETKAARERLAAR